jgi:hypothetical protein
MSLSVLHEYMQEENSVVRGIIVARDGTWRPAWISYHLYHYMGLSSGVI